VELYLEQVLHNQRYTHKTIFNKSIPPSLSLSLDRFVFAIDKHPGWKVLIVDDHAMRVISSSVGMYDIMERKVTLVESLEKKRAPFPDMAAIYVLEPSATSVRALIADFAVSEKPLYGKAVFLFFLGRLPDTLLNEIKVCSPLVKRIKSLNEINIDFLAREERAFTFEMPRDTFAALYLRQGHTPAEVEIAQKLVTVCGTLNEYPHIRYKNDSAVCTSLASVFKLKMDEFVSQNPSWWYHGGPNTTQSAAMKERGTLLLLDRADDLLSPLMHDFTYQAMVHDLIPMEGDRVTVASGANSGESSTKDSTTKDVLLDEKDNIWVELRGQHIASVIETLSNRIRDIMNSSTGSTLAGSKGNDAGGTLSLSQMAAALKALPEYQEVLSKLSQHMHLSHQCMDSFGAQQLLALAELEQTLATGKDEDGKSPKLADMMEQVESQIVKMKSSQDKIRFILICIITCSGLRTQDKRRLYSAAELTSKDTRILQESLDAFGVSIYNDNDKNRTISGLPGCVYYYCSSIYGTFALLLTWILNLFFPHPWISVIRFPFLQSFGTR
jgi:syntaxin-binding protein 1